MTKLIGGDDGEVILGGRSLSRKEVQQHLNDGVMHIRTKQLAKLLELGVVMISD